MFLSLKTLYRKRTVTWPFYFYTIIRTLSFNNLNDTINQVAVIFNLIQTLVYKQDDLT